MQVLVPAELSSVTVTQSSAPEVLRTAYAS